MTGYWDRWPQNEYVHWPRDEKIIGVLGLAPLATADFFTLCCKRHLDKDWQHPRIIVDSNPKIPSRGRFLQLGEADPVPFMQDTIRRLIEQGAQIIAIPCNTAHIFYNRYAPDIINEYPDIQIPNIIEISIQLITKLSPQMVLILASNSVIKYELYQKRLKNYGINYVIPDFSQQKSIACAIELVKQYKINNQIRKKLQDIIFASGADCVILGCTELSILFENTIFHNHQSIRFINSNQELANWCIKAL